MPAILGKEEAETVAKKSVPMDPSLEIRRKENDLASAIATFVPRRWDIEIGFDLTMREDRFYSIDFTASRNGTISLMGVIVDEAIINACKEVFSIRLGEIRVFNPFDDSWIAIWPEAKIVSDTGSISEETTDLPGNYARRLDAENR